MEFTQMFHRFGVEVTVLEHSPQLLDKEDREMAETLYKLLTQEGLRLETDVELVGVRRNMYFKDVERAVAEGETEGLVKLLVDQQGKLLGGHVLAPKAGDLLAPIILAMHADIPVDTIASAIIPYPTMAEGVRWAADKL